MLICIFNAIYDQEGKMTVFIDVIERKKNETCSNSIREHVSKY